VCFSDDCLSNLGSSDAAALEAYKKLYNLTADLGPLQEAAEGAAPHLVHHITSKTNEIHRKIEEAFSGQFEEILKKMSWPNPEASVPDNLQQEFSNCVEKLLDLQIPELEAQERANDEAAYPIAPLVLLPLRVLVKPLELGFRYHFEGNKPTNRLERPEFFLSHVTDRILAKYMGFIETYIRPLLRQKFRGTSLAMNYAYIDDASAFITALLPMVRNKLQAVVPLVLKQPPLLSHLIHEVMKFDTNLRDEWQYDGGSRTESWRGLAWEILAQDDIFGHWLKAEKDCELIILASTVTFILINGSRTIEIP
jgi:RAD50-interacting protein 1